ncbi:MAG: GyrI-like domain-containing protein [Prolixibacteraceae bacterium]|nr:GyrI-like domain-containing protein [Prolixibacteraceae bacterium]
MKTAFLIIGILVIVIIVLYFLLIGNFKKQEPEIVILDEPVLLAGLEINTNDKAIYKDVGIAAKAFNQLKEQHPIPELKDPWAAVNISKDYNPVERTFTYIVGEVVTKKGDIPSGLKYFEIPAATYAVFKIKPKSRFAWGITMGRTKRFIYAEWLPESGYSPLGLIDDFELHDERSLGKHPEIQLYVALKEK